METRPAMNVLVISSRPIHRVEDLKQPMSYGTVRWTRGNRSLMHMKRSEHPFGQGASRVAYEAQLSKNTKSLSLPCSKVVAKAFVHVGGGRNKRIHYIKEIEVSAVAEFLATLYNESDCRPSHCARIEYLKARVVEDANASAEEEDDSPRYVVEPLLPEGEFTKFNNNAGIWSEVDESLLRFSIFTHFITNGHIMVADLQGVRDRKVFHLTDPVILCRDILRFGESNLGGHFMQKCLDAAKALMEENGWYIF